MLNVRSFWSTWILPPYMVFKIIQNVTVCIGIQKYHLDSYIDRTRYNVGRKFIMTKVWRKYKFWPPNIDNIVGNIV